MKPRERLGYGELVALTASVMALNALAIDIMLPALGRVGEALGAASDNDRQLIVGVYIIANGLAQPFFGPLVDRFGRRPVILVALGGYILGSLVSIVAGAFSVLLAARAFQGAATAAARVSIMASVRDQCSGRRMAKVMSLAVTIFMAAPIIAPSLGQVVLDVFPGEEAWRGVFVALLVYGLIIAAWAALRLGETLPPDQRRAIAIGPIMSAYGDFFRDRTAIGYTIVSGLAFGALFGFINTSEQVFLELFEFGRRFPAVFAAVAGSLAAASILNARLVERVGMRPLTHAALVAFFAINVVHLALNAVYGDDARAYVVFMCASFFMLGMIGPNTSALAMERMGHIAGSAAAAYGLVGTTGAGVLGALVGRAYAGATTPVIAGFVGFGAAALALAFWIERGRLFLATPPGASAVEESGR
ncbi:MAG: multidrug effflux MFS transporter [Parvularculaceae bacterium]